MLADYFNYALYVRKNLMVPEPNDPQSLGIQPLGALFIFCFFQCMLATICFDDDALLVADKIDDKTANLFLAPELHTAELFGFQSPP